MINLRRLWCPICNIYSLDARILFIFEHIIAKTSVVGVDGVKIVDFYAADGDDNFVTTEASANNCRLDLINDGIGGRFILAALGYSTFVGNCGRSSGGYHGAGWNRVESCVRSRLDPVFFWAVLASERALSELVIAPLSPYGQISDSTVGIIHTNTCVPP